MNECKATADIVELMSRIVIVVDVVDVVDVDEGQKRSGQLQLTAKKRGISNGNTKRSMTVSRFFA